MVRDPCVALFALLNWFAPFCWLLVLTGSRGFLGCSVSVVLSSEMAAFGPWFPIRGWLLRFCDSVSLSGCFFGLVLSVSLAASHSLVLSALLVARFIWFFPFSWLLSQFGSLYGKGCSS